MTKLSHYLTSNLEPVNNFLETVTITPHGLSYGQLTSVTAKREPVSHIGENSRKRTREEKLKTIQNEQNALKKQKEALLAQKDSKESNKVQLQNFHHQFKTLKQEKDNLLKQATKTKEILSNLEIEKNKLTKDRSPLLEIFDTYNYEDLLELVSAYKEQEKNLLELNQLEEANKNLYLQVEDHKEELSRLDTSDLENQVTKAKIELEKTKDEDYKKELKDELENLTLQLHNTQAKKDDSLNLLGRLTQKEQEVSNQINRTDQEAEDLNKLLLEIHNVIDPITIDTFDNADQLLKDLVHLDTEDVHMMLEFENIPHVKLPYTARDIAFELKKLTTVFVYDEAGEKASIEHKMDQLTALVEAQETNARSLLNTAQLNFRLNLFDNIEQSYQDVEINLDRFVETLNQENPSHLQLSAEKELTVDGFEKVDLLTQSENREIFFEDLTSRIMHELEDETTDAESLKESILDSCDPRSWFDIKLFYQRRGQEREVLTTHSAHSFSTGERVRAYYLTMLGLLEVIQNQMNPEAPYIIIMDEAFATIDNTQTEIILDKIHQLSDLFIATTPDKLLPLTEHSQGGKVLRLRYIDVSGTPVVNVSEDALFEII